MGSFFSIVGLVAAIAANASAEEFFQIPADATRFSTSALYATPPELSRRMGAALPATSYDLAREGFRVIAPPSLATNSDWGLFVWVSPGHDAYIPADWGPLFARHKLVFVAPYQSGNNRAIVERCRLVLDAVFNVSRQYGVDRRRIFVGGFSGGGRIASMLAVAYADLFAGTFCVCGVNFYQEVSFVFEPIGSANVAGGSLTPGTVRPSSTVRFSASYRPPQAMRELARRNLRLYLLTGSGDPNRLNTQALSQGGFQRAGFRYVRYREISGFGHAIPGSAELEKALAFLSP